MWGKGIREIVKRIGLIIEDFWGNVEFSLG
jgi:hypothetical protein